MAWYRDVLDLEEDGVWKGNGSETFKDKESQMRLYVL